MSLWKSKTTKVSGILSYLDAGAEQEVFAVTGVQRGFIDGIILDLNTITLNGTIRVYSRIDGTNYRLLVSHTFTVGVDPVGVFLDMKFPAHVDFRVTYEESADEGAARAIPYVYVLSE